MQNAQVSADGLSTTTGYIKYAAGGLTVAYQEAYQDTANTGTATTNDIFKAVPVMFIFSDEKLNPAALDETVNFRVVPLYPLSAVKGTVYRSTGCASG